MVPPKVELSNETWKRLSRSFDKIESICKHNKKNLNLSDDQNDRKRRSLR